jgi:hypothetical protein
MKRIILAAALAAGALAMSACTSLPGTSGQNFDINKFLTDPACAHHDEITGVTGAAGVPASLQFKAARDCPGAQPAAPLAVGTVVGPAAAPPT